MPSNNNGRYIILTCLVVTAVSLNYAIGLKGEQRQMSAAYDEVKQTVVALEQERESLAQEIAAQLVSEIKGTDEAMEQSLGDEMTAELTALKEQLQQALESVVALQSENEDLKLAQNSLMMQVKVITTEREKLRTQLSSVDELKKALKVVKTRIQEEKKKARLAEIRAEDDHDLLVGNRGYMVRDGQITTKKSTGMRVRVLEPETVR